MTVGARLTFSEDAAEPLYGGVIGLALKDMVIPVGGVETARLTGELKYSNEFTVTIVEPDAPTSRGIGVTGEK